MSSINDLPPPPGANRASSGIDDLPAPPAAEPIPSTGAGQAALEHFGNSASLGYLPQLQSVAAGATPDPNAALDDKLKAQGFKISQPEDTYVQRRDQNIARLQKEGEEHPYASAAGTVAGALAGGAALSTVAPINAAGRIGRIAQAAKGGAIMGALSNPGDTQGKIDLTQLDDRAGNTAKGAALGMAGQGAIEGLSAGAKAAINLPAAMQGKAEERAFKAAGAMLKDYRDADKSGKINELGRWILDNGLVKPGNSVSEIADQSASIRNQLGEKIGAAYDKAASALAGQDVPLAKLDPKQLGEEFLNEYAASQKGAPGGGARLRSVKSVVDDLQGLPSDGGFSGVNKFRQALDDLVYAHNKTPGTLPETKEGLAALRSWLDQRVDGAISAVDRATGGQVSQELPDLNRQYGLASQVAKISRDQTLRQNANRFFSPSDYLSAGTGAIAGASSGHSLEERARNAAIGAGLGLANKAARTYGTPLVSIGLDNAGALLAKTGAPALGAMAKPALDAAERSPGALATVDSIMSQPNTAQMTLPQVAAGDKPADRAPAKGEDKWVQTGAEKLGLSGPELDRAMQSKEMMRLLVQASDLTPGSKAMQRIKEQIQKAQGSK